MTRRAAAEAHAVLADRLHELGVPEVVDQVGAATRWVIDTHEVPAWSNAYRGLVRKALIHPAAVELEALVLQAGRVEALAPTHMHQVLALWPVVGRRGQGASDELIEAEPEELRRRLWASSDLSVWVRSVVNLPIAWSASGGAAWLLDAGTVGLTADPVVVDRVVEAGPELVPTLQARARARGWWLL